MTIVIKDYSGASELLSSAEVIKRLRGQDKQYGRNHVEVCWQGEDGKVPFGYDVDIYGAEVSEMPDGTVRHIKGAEVNWGALGSQTPEDARLYADLIRVSAELAQSVNAGLTIMTREEAWEESRAQRAAITAQHGTHTEYTEHCHECWKAQHEKEEIVKAANALEAKTFQKRADRLYKQAHKLDWQMGTYEQRNAARDLGECQSTEFRRGRGRGKHTLNHTGECVSCHKNIVDLELAYGAAVAMMQPAAKEA